MAAKNNGTSILSLKTNREPDSARGKNIKHFELDVPSDILAEIENWEMGRRNKFSPSEAVEMLWKTDAASSLDGRIDAWLDVPGIQLIIPGWKVLKETPLGQWPKNQSELQKLIANAVDPGIDVQVFIKQLITPNKNPGIVTSLNDLVLIFKYAAIGKQRNIHLVVDLYRLARTLLAQEKDAPSESKEIFNWLTAPLIVPTVFTTPLGPRGPKQSVVPSINSNSTSPPADNNFDMSTEWGRATIAKISEELDKIHSEKEEESTFHVLKNAGIEDPKKVANAIKMASSGNVRTSLGSSNYNRLVKRVIPALKGRRNSNILTNIGGFPVRVNTNAINERKDRLRRENNTKLLNSLPQSLKDRFDSLNVNEFDEYVIALPDDNFFGDQDLPYHPPGPHTPSYLKPVGRTDLLLIRQTTIGYRRAEIAHIENVLIGETRTRDHTKRILSRDELFESTEQETEESTNLQTSDSSELSNEVNEIISEQARAEGSVEITYRGATKIVAKAAGSFEKSTENTSNAVTEYATEIIESAVKRIYERKNRKTKSLFEQEVTEKNLHHFERASDAEKHVSGIYQYIERVSRAKIFSYGERDLYDILVPEPASLIWDLSIPPEEDLDIQAVEPNHDLFNSLTLENIEEKREAVIKAFRVTDFPAVLEEALTHGEPFADRDTSGSTQNVFVWSKTVRIEDGYAVDKATFSAFGEVEGGKYHPDGGVTIGAVTKRWSSDSFGNDPLEFDLSPSFIGKQIALALNIENYNSIQGTITLYLTLTSEKRREWAVDAYSRVMTHYEQMNQDYQLAKLRATAIQEEKEEIDLPLGARRRLNKIVRNELQRSAIGIMRNAPVDFNLTSDYFSFFAAPAYPATNILEQKASEPEIRFLQQAFEWEHLSWVLYPYFWGHRTNWSNTVVQDHPDPDFTAFLNAGSARLQISVRPGFESQVKHFMETGEVYEGEGLPKMGDAGYVPFIDEQINVLGGPAEEVPWPPEKPSEWDIVTPTPLVLVRKADEIQLPKWAADTGEEIKEI